MTNSADSVQLAVSRDWRRDWADLLLGVEGPSLICDLVDMAPDRLPRNLAESAHAFLRFRFDNVRVVKINEAVCHHGTGKAPSGRHAPADFQTLCGKRLEQACFATHPVAVWAAPLGPVVR